MLQELIASPARHDMNSCKHDLGNHRGIAILSIDDPLTSGIDIKDDEAARLWVEDPANGLCGPPRGLVLLLEECAECL